MPKTFAMTPEDAPWECALDAKAEVGEVPVWSQEEKCLYWIDVFAGRLHRTDFRSAQTQTWETGEVIGCYALVEGGTSAVLALQSGIHRLDLSSGELERLYDAPYDATRFRFNDGRCDRQGRFWVGNMPLPPDPRPVGVSAFWCLDDSGMRIGVEGTTIANGIAFSPTGETLYLADDATSSILAFDYDTATGVASERRTFASVPPGMTLDGASVDTDGGYWTAFPRNGVVARFEPGGALDRVITAPTSFPTMVCFGGHDFRSVYVTTGRRKGDDSDPLAGGIFCCDLGARGVPEPRMRRLSAR